MNHRGYPQQPQQTQQFMYAQQGQVATAQSQIAAAQGFPSPAAAAAAQLSKEDAMSFLEKVRLRFSSRPEIYQQFLDVMQEFKDTTLDVDAVKQRVRVLFKDSKDLLEGFNTFLPQNSRIAPSVEASLMAAGSAANTQSYPDEENREELEQALVYVRKVQNRFQHSPTTYQEFLDILEKYKHFQKELPTTSPEDRDAAIKSIYSRISTLFRDHHDLIREFAQFLPETSLSNPAEETISGVRMGSGAEAGSGASRTLHDLHLFTELKEALGEVSYSDLLRAIALFSKTVITRGALLTLIRPTLDAAAPALRSRLLSVLGITADSSGMVSGGSVAAAGATLTASSSSAAVPPGSLPPASRADPPAAYSGAQQPSNSSHGTLDTSTASRCGPSYRKMPPKYARQKCSGRDALCDSVLNDTWVSVAVGSEEGSFRSSRKNQFEENMYRTEDEQYNLDMLIEVNDSCVRALTPIAEEIHRLGPEEASKYKLNANTLGVVQVGAIYRLYESHGGSILNLLRQQPARAVPVILRRLCDKDTELRQLRREWSAIWMDRRRRNYSRALDVQGLQFKASDKTLRSAKAQLEDAQEKLATQRRRGVRNRPQYVYACDSGVIHNTIMGLTLAIADKVLSAADAKQVRNFVNGFIDPLLAPSSSDGMKLKDVEERLLAAATSASAGEAEDVEMNGNSGDRKEKKKEKTPLEAANKRRVFLANDALFIVIRMYMIMYERFSRARALSVEVARELTHTSARPVRYQTAPGVARGLTGPATVVPVGRDDRTSMEVAAKAFADGEPAGALGEPKDLVGAAVNGGKGVTAPGTRKFAPSTVSTPNHPPSYIRLPGVPSPASDDAEGILAAGIPSPTPETADDPDSPGHPWGVVLFLITRLLNGEMDQQSYEDALRERVFGTSSYLFYTLDRFLSTFTRHLLAVAVDEASTNLVGLYSFHASRDPSDSDCGELAYRCNALQVMGGTGHVYRIYKYLEGGEALTIQLLDSNTRFVANPATQRSAWSRYVEQYISSPETFSDPQASRLFMVRNRALTLDQHKKFGEENGKAGEEDVEMNGEKEITSSNLPALPLDANLYIRNGLTSKICVQTYHMFYVEASEDLMVRHGCKSLGNVAGGEQEVAKAVGRRAPGVRRFRDWHSAALTAAGVEPSSTPALVPEIPVGDTLSVGASAVPEKTPTLMALESPVVHNPKDTFA